MSERKSSRTGDLFRSIFNPRVWMSYDQISESTSYLLNLAYRLFTVKEKQTQQQSFEQLCKQMRLDAASLAKKERHLRHLALIMAALSVPTLGYALYQFIIGSYHSFLASCVIVGVLLSMAFRYHFWCFQIRRRRLGCTIRQWFFQGLLGIKE